MEKKGQVSFEFTIILILLFSLFLFAIWVFQGKNTELIFSKENFEAELLSEKFSREINNVFLAGHGTETKILLEKNADFNVSVPGDKVIVSWRGYYADAPLLTGNVKAGSIRAGGFVNIRNVNGGIEIENA